MAALLRLVHWVLASWRSPWLRKIQLIQSLLEVLRFGRLQLPWIAITAESGSVDESEYRILDMGRDFRPSTADIFDSGVWFRRTFSVRKCLRGTVRAEVPLPIRCQRKRRNRKSFGSKDLRNGGGGNRTSRHVFGSRYSATSYEIGRYHVCILSALGEHFTARRGIG